MRRYYANFTYQAGSWTKPRRVVAKVEWHPGELYPRVGFIVTNMAGSAENVVAFYNKRGTCEQWIKEGPTNANVTFDFHCQRNRPGLLLSAGVVYAAFATFSCEAGCANAPYHG